MTAHDQNVIKWIFDLNICTLIVVVGTNLSIYSCIVFKKKFPHLKMQKYVQSSKKIKIKHDTYSAEQSSILIEMIMNDWNVISI